MTLAEEPMNAAASGTDELTTTEEAVVRMWIDVLECRTVGPESNFLELGGDSVTMMMLLFQVHETFGVELSAGEMLEASNLRAFCIRIDRALAADRAIAVTREVADLQ